MFVPLERVSPELQHAVVAAEDARFYQHHGFDWHEIRNAVEDDLDDRRVRGASTITQQLIKNLFFGTRRSFSVRPPSQPWSRWPSSSSASAAFWNCT